MSSRIAMICFALLALAASSPMLAQGCQPTDLTAYFVPSYPGWDTAKRTWIGSDPGNDYQRWYSYAINKYAHIKFNDGHYVETYTFDPYFIYITAENSPPDTRVYPPGGNGLLGLVWLPRYGYTCPGCTPKQTIACDQNNAFDPCYAAEVHYNSTCQFTYSVPAHCATRGSFLDLAPYPYGYSIGTLNSLIKIDTLDLGGQEWYYYGLGRGLLRYERYDASNHLVQWGQQTGEVANQPIPDQACFHP